MRVPQKIRNLFELCFVHDSRQRNLHRLKNRDYSSVTLARFSEGVISKVRTHAEEIHGDNEQGWNYYSNALRREVVQTFEFSVHALIEQFSKVDYLEIGSAQGLSMSVIALMLDKQGALGQLVSIDPYFEDGYYEGAKGIWKKNSHVSITKKTKQAACQLYRSLGIDVELFETVSSDGLRSLIREGRKFHLIYIDGSHEGLNPIVDFGISCSLLHAGGIIMLDDHHWPDVSVVKLLCDNHCVEVHECWKIAAYKLRPLV
jgi:predicted O-methyltransferase YrrM